MNNTLIAKISSFTLESRKKLEKEASEQLEGLYGWLPDGTFADASFYPAVATLPEARSVRGALEEHALASEQAGTAPKDARKELVRETAFTWLNRFVALRMMEERGLVKTTLSKHHNSAGFLFWVAEEGNEREYELQQAGESPLDAAGEGPRHVAYRRFLLGRCADLSNELPVLFDTSDLPSRLFPRPVALLEFLESMNEKTLAEAWRKGNEETVGWVYQSFISEEKKRIFDDFSRGGKAFAEDIGPATQIFTPEWIVRYLIESSLGNLWMEIHPDSVLKDKLSRSVFSPNPSRRPLKLARDISFLDPACGSMHFGLAAFDVFAEMYKEELANAGQPGWPEKASVEREEDIPGAIVANNIHGIDIDLRAVQLSALTLFLKARGGNPKSFFNDRNIVCANVEPLVGSSLDEFVRASSSEHPVVGRVLQTLSVTLRESDSLGSLVRLEEDLRRLVAEERRKAVVDRQKTFDMPGIRKESFESADDMDSFFDALEADIEERLDRFVRSSGETKRNAARFAHEASKGIRLLDIVRRRYDVVATNPPYMSRRNQSPLIASFLDEAYPDSKTDLYAAFISRCNELAGSGGTIAMITQQSFMFITSYENLRAALGSEVCVQSMAHLGPRAFDMVTGEKVNTTAFVLRKEADEKTRRNREGVFFRLVKGRDGEEKRRTFEEAVAANRSGEAHRLVFSAKQADFEAVPGKPWVYWMPERLVRMFSELELIGTVAQPRVGLQTGDNEYFLRKWWEVGKGRIGFGFSSCEETRDAMKMWYPYMKGGTPYPWYGNQEHVLNWKNDGKQLYAFRPTSVIRNPSFYFRPGVTWSDVSSKGFAARLSPGGFIHDVTGMTCFPDKEHILMVLGVLNSRIAKYLLAALNPTIHAQVGDIARLPVPEERSPVIDALVEECVELAREDSRESETTYEFAAPPVSVEEVAARKRLLSEKEAAVDAEVSRLYGLTEEDLAAIDRELSDGAAPAGDDDSPEGERDDEDDAAAGELTVEEWGRRWLSYAAGIALGRFEVGAENGLGRGRFPPSVVASLRASKLVASKGFLLNDPGEPLDLAERVCSILELLLGETGAAERIRAALGEGSPRSLVGGWFARFTGQPASSFWRFHFQTYRKRPVYWPLQSPGRKFTVWLFHERLTGDTLFSLRNAVVEPRVRLAERRIEDLKGPAESERAARQELERTRDLAEDLRAFSASLEAVMNAGYTPHADDGVLLNAAPLWPLLPSWTETKKAWLSLERGEYDWAHQAMDRWPERVKEACRANRSYAVAHGLEHLAPPSPAASGGGTRRGGRRGTRS